jgi:hypothetical protein
MTDQRRDDGGEVGPGTEDQVAKTRENEDVDSLFVKLRAVARTEEAEMAAMPPSFVSPLSGADREAMVSAIVAARPLDRERTEPRDRASAAPGATRTRGRRLWPAILIPFAVAAGLVLVQRPRSMVGVGSRALPAYEVLASGGLAEQRGLRTVQTEGPGVVSREQKVDGKTELVIVARPATAVQGPVAVRAFLVRETSVQEIDPRVELAPSGSAQLRVRLGDRAREAHGRAALKILVGEPAAVRSTPPADATHDAPPSREMRWLTVPLEVVGD